MKTFIQACLENSKDPPDINDWIDDWHEGRGPARMPLHEFLGMSWEDYGKWIQDPAFLQELLARKT